jgi:hypothetical protein
MLIRPQIEKVETRQDGPVKRLPSELIQALINMPTESEGIAPFSLALRHAFQEIIDCSFPNIGFVAGRQVGKTTFPW